MKKYISTIITALALTTGAFAQGHGPGNTEIECTTFDIQVTYQIQDVKTVNLCGNVELLENGFRISKITPAIYYRPSSFDLFSELFHMTTQNSKVAKRICLGLLGKKPVSVDIKKIKAEEGIVLNGQMRGFDKLGTKTYDFINGDQVRKVSVIESIDCKDE